MTRAWVRHLRVSEDLYRRLDAAAEERGLSLEFVVTRLLEEGLERLIPAEEFSQLRPLGTTK